ncbi:MAG: hypothetical protein WKF84_07700 [Pyrinomonadaceae bacterium]
MRKCVGDGWALLGDAAGFADPVTGEEFTTRCAPPNCLRKLTSMNTLKLTKPTGETTSGREVNQGRADARTLFTVNSWEPTLQK